MNDLLALIHSGSITVDYIKKRLFAKIDKEGRLNDTMSRCWISLGCPASGGYGQIMVKGCQLNTHRLSWALHNGFPDMTSLDVVGHLCDNPTCCNPDHLELIDNSKNIKDAYDRIRDKKVPKERIRVSVACDECRKDKHHKCSEGETCIRCKTLGLVCIRQPRTQRAGDFKKGACSGERNANAKLTDAQRAEIVDIARKGFEYGQRKALAELYGIRPEYISDLVKKADTIEHA